LSTNRLVRGDGDENELSLLPIELVAHCAGEFLELALGLCVIAFDHDVVEMPEPPTEILETLSLLEMSSDLCANLPGFGQGLAVVHVMKGDKGLVAL
jgi:hypothetical protein